MQTEEKGVEVQMKRQEKEDTLQEKKSNSFKAVLL